MTIPDEVDIIVVGGGSCGCVVAGRLANLDHNLQVMLIEAGESNLNVCPFHQSQANTCSNKPCRTPGSTAQASTRET